MSHETSPSEQGQLQGAINSLRGISGIIGPGLFTYIFSKSIGDHAVISLPGMPFYVAASMLLAGLVVAEFATRHDPSAVQQA
jgi:DHA1 family tetracycline resistance protein-like MFS transporter